MKGKSLELHERINMRGIVDGWARIAIERYQKELKKKKIYDTGKLYRSFQKELTMNGNDVKAVYIRFLLYGRFVDMGVGKGLRGYERKMNTFNRMATKWDANVSFINRKPRRWFNKPKMAQIYKLRDLLGKELGNAIVQNIQDGFSDDVTQYQVKI